MEARRILAFTAALIGLLTTGCYSSEGLITKTRNKAIRTRIDEVELGEFRVTLPRDVTTGEMTEMTLRLFGESERYKINEIEDDLKARGPKIEDTAIRTLRETNREDLIDPDLKKLRTRLLAAMNEELNGAPLKSIGFYEIRFIRH